MKKILLVMVLMLALAVPAFADNSRYYTRTSRGLEATGMFTDADGNTMDDGPYYIYSISIYADAANSFVGVYDVASQADMVGGTEYPRDEIGEATQYDVATKPYNPPAYYAEGVGGIMSTGVAFVEYGPPTQ